MNKQPSKESLKGKVEEIFGLGHPQPPSKQTIITSLFYFLFNQLCVKKNKTSHQNTHIYKWHLIYMVHYVVLHCPLVTKDETNTMYSQTVFIIIFK
uniref:Uncharacterized protein n=1 Tax=Sander lucioperca TaxID=283035 RepID=A0A8C9Z872_SANLU